MEGLHYIALKSQKDKGGSERRINALAVSGIFGMCMSTDIEHLNIFYERESRSRDKSGRGQIMKKVWDLQRILGDKREEME